MRCNTENRGVSVPWLLCVTVIVGELLIVAPRESVAKILPDGRRNRFPLALRGDRGALWMLVLAVNLLAATGFLAWPFDAYGPGSTRVLVGALWPMMLVGPATWWLLAALDSRSMRSDEEEAQ